MYDEPQHYDWSSKYYWSSILDCRCSQCVGCGCSQAVVLVPTTKHEPPGPTWQKGYRGTGHSWCHVTTLCVKLCSLRLVITLWLIRKQAEITRDYYYNYYTSTLSSPYRYVLCCWHRESCCTMWSQSDERYLSHHHHVVVCKLVVGHLQVEGGGAFPDAARGVVMRAVAWAVVTAEISGVCNGHAAQVRAHPDDYDPLGVHDPVLVVLRVSQLCDVHSGFGGDLLLCAVTDEQWLASPLEGHVLAFGDVVQLNFNFGQGQDVSGGTHGRNKLSDHRFGSIDADHGRGPGDQVGEGFSGIITFLRWLAGVEHLWAPVVREVWYPDVCVSKSDPGGACRQKRSGSCVRLQKPLYTGAWGPCACTEMW